MGKKQIRLSFGSAAQSYDQFSELQRQVSAKLTKKLFEQQLPGHWLLDLGCGTGHFAELASAVQLSAKKIIGFDSALPMLNLAQAKTMAHSSCCWVAADAEQLPLAKNSIDIIFSSLMMQWCHNLATVFSEMKRVIQPGGVIAFSTFGVGSLMELKTAWGQVDQYRHVNDFHSQELLANELGRAGLTFFDWQSEMITLNYREVLHILQALKGIGANAVVRDNKYQKLTGKGRLQEMIAAYEQYRHNELLPVTYEIIYVVVKAK